MVKPAVYSCKLTRTADSLTSPTSAMTSTSRASSFRSPPSSEDDVNPARIASNEASRIGFLMSFIAALMRGPNKSFPSFACAVLSTEESKFPAIRAANGFRFICVSASRSRNTLVSSTSSFNFGGDVSSRPLHCLRAASSSSSASFRFFQAVFPSFDPCGHVNKRKYENASGAERPDLQKTPDLPFCRDNHLGAGRRDRFWEYRKSILHQENAVPPLNLEPRLQSNVLTIRFPELRRRIRFGRNISPIHPSKLVSCTTIDTGP